MKKYNADLSDEQLGGILNDYSEQANEYVDDDSKFARLIEKVKAVLCHLTRVPVIGGYVNDILDITEMIADYRAGNYRVLPKRTVIASLAVLLYLITPVDLIPDFIPLIGWADDAAVIGYAYKKGLKADLDAYREWKELNIFADGNEVIDCE